jgi:protein subunit release factor B
VTSRQAKVRQEEREVRLKEAHTWSLGLEEAEVKEIVPDADRIRSDQIRSGGAGGQLEFKAYIHLTLPTGVG